MIIDFTVSNFRSIKEPQTLSLLAASDKDLPDNTFVANDIEKTRLLKTAVIYGANGSGKSNLILAWQAMLEMIQFSTDEKRGEQIDTYTPFKLDKNAIVSPITFELEFISSDDVRYRYGFSFTAYEIEREFLFTYPRKQEAKLFIREKGKNIDFGDSLTGAKKSIESLLLPNQLFLSKAANNNHTQLGDIYQYIIGSGSQPTDSKSILSRLYARTELVDELKKIMKIADVGIKDILIDRDERIHNIRRTSDNRLITTTSYDYIITTFHSMYNENGGSEEVIFSLDEESEGTRKLFYFGAELLISLSQRQDVLIIDEMNNSFHPLITEMIIRLLQSPETNPNNAQLIFTTHDTSVLRSDLFRRDQVWFTEKDTYGATSLYSLAEFDKSKVRANIPYDKWYLSGRFGALPLIKDFDFLKETKPTPPNV